MRSMLMRKDFESSMRRRMPKHALSSTGCEDMAVMRYERRTVAVGSRPRTALDFATCDSGWVDRSCAVDTDEAETFWRAL